MSVSVVPTLQSKIQKCINKKNNARNQITRYERAYESLSNFKTTVSQAQEDFRAINTNKSSVLSEVVHYEEKQYCGAEIPFRDVKLFQESILKLSA